MSYVQIMTFIRSLTTQEIFLRTSIEVVNVSILEQGDDDIANGRTEDLFHSKRPTYNSSGANHCGRSCLIHELFRKIDKPFADVFRSRNPLKSFLGMSFPTTSVSKMKKENQFSV